MVDQSMYQGAPGENPLEYSLRMVVSLAYATCTEQFRFSYLALKGTEYDSLAGTGESFYQELAV